MAAPWPTQTKAKIRNLLSVLFNHAIRYEWLDQGKNPITLVRQSAKRKQIPEVLEPFEIQNLLLELKSCFRLMVMLDVTTGLRRSELFALKWRDVDFSNLRLDVLRSIYLRHLGDCKTEASRKPVPLDERVAADLWVWKGNESVSPTRRLDIRESSYPREISVLARCRDAKGYPPSSATSRNQQENRVAYIPAHVLDASYRKWRKREGRSGVDAPRQQPLHAGGLFAGADNSQAPSTAARGSDDFPRGGRYTGTHDSVLQLAVGHVVSGLSAG